MKSLVKKILNSKISILVRNTFNFKPVYLRYIQKNYPITISDSFLWRTDNGYKTKFKYSDLLTLFYNIKNSSVELHFYSKDNKLLKIKKINNLNISNELEITKEFLNNNEDYGVFYIYHFIKNEDFSLIESKNVLSNRCYLGYSHNNSLYSFVHGNTLARYTGLNDNNYKKISTDIIKMSLLKNQNYTIQKYFDKFDKNELFFTNSTSKLLKFSLENQNYQLLPGCTTLIKAKNKIINIKSNCLFLRPTVFSYRGKFFDVHHS